MRRVSMLLCSFQCTKQKKAPQPNYPDCDAKLIVYYNYIKKKIASWKNK